MSTQSLWSIDWHALFVPTGSLLELVVRGTVIYLLILAAFRVFRREAGSIAISDLLVVVMIADAAQNAIAGEYKSLTEGIVLVATIFAWNVSLDWLSYRNRFVHWLLHPPPVLLVNRGKIQHRNLRAELITRDDLLEQLRQQGVEDLAEVKACWLESDGHLSVIKFQNDAEPSRQKKRIF